MTNTLYRSQLADRRRKQLLDAVAELRLLPTTVSVPMKILQLQRNPNTHLSEYCAALVTDPSLTSKVLALANSAALAPGRTITKVSEAIARIGVKNLLSLVFGLSVGGIFNKMGVPAAEAKALWRAALLKAVAARELAMKTEPSLAEEAYVCGLLQDISLPIISATDPSAWPEALAILELGPDARRQREEAMYGTDHGTIGKLVAARIGLPPLFQTAIEFHHGDVAVMAALGSPALAGAVEFAAVLPHRLTGFSANVLNKLTAKLADFDPNHTFDHSALLESISAAYGATMALLGESDESSGAVREFLQAVGAEVAGILEGAIAESISQISQLRSHGAELEGKISELKREAVKSDYDVLTKALSRRGFIARAERFLALAREYETACAVGFADVDNFKSLNDRLGHAAGDAALVQVGERLCEHFRGRGIVGRVGGDEFAFLVISKSRDEVAAEADRLNTAFSGMTACAGAGPLPLTTSIGMQWIGVPTPEQTPEITLKSADEVMYGVKRSGKGRCVVAHAG